MGMRTRSISRHFVIVAFALPLALALAACGQTVVSTPPPQRAATLPPGETLYLVDGAGGSGGYGQHLVAVQPTTAKPTALMALPAGLVSADHSVLYAATPNASGGTTLARVDLHTGATQRALTLAEHYMVSGDGWGDATLSEDGQWLALTRADAGGAKTVIALVDTQAMRVTRTFTLDGSFTLDAAANGGHMLYLLQTLNDAARHYYVRGFDTQAGQLEPGYIVDKTALNETWNMAGYAVARQTASDGSVDYTLYVAPGLNQAFIHALPLATDANGGGFAHCINLPVGASADLLRYYTLVMAPDGTALYAANAALGVVATISLHGDSSNVFSDAVTVMAHFTPASAMGGAAGAPYGQHPLENGAALSRDGKTLYVAGPDGVRAFDTGTLAARGTYLAGQAVTSIAASANGQTLYAVNPAAGLSVIDLSAGAGGMPRTVQPPMQGLWGIAWVRE